ncbi:MAG: class I SAM-dependent methyltransferase [Betaproteobacteria bacterium]|nr:class I SAM-dependent methyltransferase [Betaproteobacteria bacterium]
MKPQILEFWRQAQLFHINPGVANDFPEGWDVREELREIFGDRHVSDIGCGYGRLCTAFRPDHYAGYDLNPVAIETARHRYPEYRFTLMRDPSDYGTNDAALLYAVLLHIHDDDIEAVVKQLCDSVKFLVVAEIMLRSWRGSDATRQKQAPPVFNRDVAEYVAMFAKHGFDIDDVVIAPYKRYPDTDMTFLVLARGRSKEDGG